MSLVSLVSLVRGEKVRSRRDEAEPLLQFIINGNIEQHASEPELDIAKEG